MKCLVIPLIALLLAASCDCGYSDEDVGRIVRERDLHWSQGIPGLTIRTADLPGVSLTRDPTLSFPPGPARYHRAARPTPGREVLVLVPGFPGHAGMMHDLLSAPLLAGGTLVDRYDVIVPELPGTGLSSWQLGDEATFQRYSIELVRLLEHLGTGPVHLFGHSYGGEVCWRTSSDFPSLVKSQFLLSPSGFPRLDNELSSIERQLKGLSGSLGLATQGWPGLECLSYMEACGDDIEQGLRQAYHRDWLLEDGRVVWEYKLATCRRPNLHDLMRLTWNDLCDRDAREVERAIARIRAPTVAVWGEHDPWFTMETQGRSFASAADGNFRLIWGSYADVGHNGHEEDPAGVANCIHAMIESGVESLARP